MPSDRTSQPHPVISEYAKLASVYDSRWARYIQATTNATLERLPIVSGDVLDIGCGTGALLHGLVRDLPRMRLTGLDASLSMLDIACDRLPQTVTLRQGWAEKLPFLDSSFDMTISCNMFHYIRQPETALREMLRVLRPNGVLAITDWCDDYLTCKLCNFYLRWFDPSHHQMYGTTELHQLLEDAGAKQIAVEKYKISWLWGLMTATAVKPATTPPLQPAPTGKTISNR